MHNTRKFFIFTNAIERKILIQSEIKGDKTDLTTSGNQNPFSKYLAGEISLDELNNILDERTPEIVKQWKNALSGTILKSMNTDWDQDPLNSGGCRETTTWILQRDYKYRFIHESHLSLDTYNPYDPSYAFLPVSSLSRSSRNEDGGNWWIYLNKEQLQLVFDSINGQQQIYSIRSHQKGFLHLNNEQYHWCNL